MSAPCGWTLAHNESDKDFGTLFIVQIHVAVKLIIILVFKKRNPLFMCAKASLEDDGARDGDRSRIGLLSLDQSHHNDSH